jgi:hypothetical protein
MASVTDDEKMIELADDLPESLSEFLDSKQTHKWRRDWHAKELDVVDINLALSFYTSTYSMKELRRDVKAIKEAMKTARTYCY